MEVKSSLADVCRHSLENIPPDFVLLHILDLINYHREGDKPLKTFLKYIEMNIHTDIEFNLNFLFVLGFPRNHTEISQVKVASFFCFCILLLSRTVLIPHTEMYSTRLYLILVLITHTLYVLDNFLFHRDHTLYTQNKHPHLLIIVLTTRMHQRPTNILKLVAHSVYYYTMSKYSLYIRSFMFHGSELSESLQQHSDRV